MSRRFLFTILTALLLVITALAVYLFVQNLDLQSKVEKLEKRENCIVCQTDCSKCETDNNQSTTYPIKVYFSKNPESLDDPTKVYAVNRTSPTLGVATYAISQMLVGPTNEESANGYFSDIKLRDDISNCNDNDFTLNISSGVVTLKFCRAFDSIGTMSDARAQETIKATLLQFTTINKVIILAKNGDCLFNASGLNLCLQ